MWYAIIFQSKTRKPIGFVLDRGRFPKAWETVKEAEADLKNYPLRDQIHLLKIEDAIVRGIY
jgi:hypothetical protein